MIIGLALKKAVVIYNVFEPNYPMSLSLTMYLATRITKCKSSLCSE